MPTTRTPSRHPAPVPSRSIACTLPLVALLASVGCAAPAVRDEAPLDPDDAVAATSSPPSAGTMSYTVARGDRLSEIARDFMGDATLWREIATLNGIDDPRSLRAGSVLQIPGELVPGHGDAPVPTDTAPVTARPTIGGGLGLRRVPPVELSPVDINRQFELSPMTVDTLPNATSDATSDTSSNGAFDTMPDSASAGAARDEPQDGRRIKVIGSYFPKGIYAQPATYSKLLMRVAPGTIFELERETSDWYGVVTTLGVGYLRDTDGRLLDELDGERTAALDLPTGDE